MPETHRLRSPDKLWGGPATGDRCAVCGESTTPGEIELEIEFTHDSEGGRTSTTSTLSVSRFSIASSSAFPGGPITSAFSARLSPWTTKFREAAKTHSHDHGWQRGSKVVYKSLHDGRGCPGSGSWTFPRYAGRRVWYVNASKALVSEAEWVALVRAVAAGDQGALHALDERTNRVAFTLIVRITANRETAEEVTMDVFHDVWRRASRYQETHGQSRWIMNLARSRAIDRLRFDQRKKRVPPGTEDPLPATRYGRSRGSRRVQATERSASQRSGRNHARRARSDRGGVLFELTYAEVAARFNQPLGTIKTRIRSGLHKLRTALAEEGLRP